MHGLCAAQRTASIALGGHHAHAPGKGRAAQPATAPFARGFPASPRTTAGWLGHTGKSARAGGYNSVPESGGRVIAAFPQPTPAGHVPGVACEVKFFTLALIRFYQACLSPAYPSACRFYPSCSTYAYEAVEKWGAWRGVRLALGRLLRCRPFGGHGIDPVP